MVLNQHRSIARGSSVPKDHRGRLENRENMPHVPRAHGAVLGGIEPGGELRGSLWRHDDRFRVHGPDP